MSCTLARPPLTSTEKDILKDLVKNLAETESQFCCGGTIQLPAHEKLDLFYKGENSQALKIELASQNLDAIKQLLEFSVPSAHGHGTESVYDESYRLARELHRGNFALTIDILNDSGVIPTITALTSPRNPSDGLVARLYKLNAYTTGGFFKPHRDTPKSDNHIGTLVVALPVPFEGGALRVSHEGKQVLFDWGKDALGSGSQFGLPWAFLFSDVEHEVLPVTSGTRVTLAYDIFASDKSVSSILPTMDGTTLPFYSDLTSALQNRQFFPRGGKVAMTLSHAYPITSNSSSDAFANHLKGSDAALYRILSTLQIPVTIRAVYSANEIANLDADMQRQIPNDEFGPLSLPVYGHHELLYTSKNLSAYTDNFVWEEGEDDIITTGCEAEIEADLIWARKPSQDVFSESGRYAYYGNEPTIETLYAAAAFVFNIPGVGQSPRA